MYKIGDTVLYGREGVCKIKDIVTRKLNNIDKQYYFLTPLDDHITILVPTDNEEALSKMRKVLSKKDKMLYDEFCHTLNLKSEQILPFILETLKEN